MKIGQIVKIKRNAQRLNPNAIPPNTLGMIYKIDNLGSSVVTTRYKVFTEIGTELVCSEDEVFATRGVPETTRDKFEKIMSLYKEQLKIEQQIQELQDKKSTIVDKRKDVMAKLVAEREKANGLMSKDAVLELCKNKFGKLLANGYEAHIWNTTVSFNYHKDIQKYFRSASFLYEEYDGTMAFEHNYKDNREYQGYLSRYGNKVSGIKLPFEENLSLEDKDWLVYNSRYTLEFKDLKKETVKKTITKFL